LVDDQVDLARLRGSGRGAASLGGGRGFAVEALAVESVDGDRPAVEAQLDFVGAQVEDRLAGGVDGEEGDGAEVDGDGVLDARR
jgi:hypothetical protein